MRITQPLSFIAKQMAKTIAKKTLLVSFGFTLLASGVIAGQNLLTTPDSASAATPPDSCFAFNAGTGTITDYYNNEANNSANPACPRAVDIPATIGGVSVVSIGTNAFYNNQLTTVTIPSGVTSIGDSAFYDNQLTSVTIPEGVTSIGGGAFWYNQLTSAVLLGSPASIGDGVFEDNRYLTSITYSGTTYDDTMPTPEQCFEFSSGVANGYKFADLNAIKNNGVSCLNWDIAIPDTINGEPVTSIGTFAFRDSFFSSITLPSGLISIDRSAFANNRITSVTLPASVTSVDPTAFFMQNPWGGYIEYDEPGIPYLYSSDLSIVQQVYDNFWYVRITTEDPLNLNNIQSSIAGEHEYFGNDRNNNGTTDDSYGGHLINPSSTELRYLDRSGTAIGAPQTITGMLNGSPLTNYYASQGPVVPEVNEWWNPTSTEQAALDQALSAYHRAGSTQTFTPQAISGYVTPAPQAKTLVAGDNTLDFTYNRPVLSVPFVSNDVADGVLVPSTTPGSVASPLLSESKLSIANDNTCSTIQSAELLAPGSVSAPQGITMLGGLGFTLDCTTAATTTVSLTLGSQANPDTLRVYKDIAGTLTDITSHMTFTTSNGKTILTYNLTDGGAFDEDDAANGTIVDPIYIGVAGSGELASTGINATMVVAVGVVTLAAGIAFAMRRDVVRAPIRTRQ